MEDFDKVSNKKSLFLLENTTMYSSEIYLVQNQLKFSQYHIYNLKNEIVGMIEYRDENHSLTGDIGYMIKKQYRGNNFAYKALCLLGRYLSDYGIEEIIISSRSDNISSLKTIYKYGGTLIKVIGDICVFKCNNNLEKNKNFKEGLNVLEKLKEEEARLKYLINDKKNEILISKGEIVCKKKAELKKIEEKLQFVQQEIFNYTKPSISDGVIDLIKVSNNKDIYMIKLSETNQVVGRIEYRGYHYNLMLGDIGYEIYEVFRGNNYAYKALCLLGEMLSQDGIDDFWITAYDDNKASMKIISNYNGEFVEKIGGLNLYVCSSKLDTYKKRRLNEI